jgi:aryl-alcohol dehydrogenase-like predicted oxidoreductase
MKYRPLGRTGVQVSALCLGAMNFGGPTNEADAIQILNTALDAGINFVDTANSYNAGESERILGRAFKANGRRDQCVLATKVFNRTGDLPNDGGGSRFHITQACEASLRRLQTDHIDLYQLHRPFFDAPQDETLRAFDDLVHAGKVIYVGCSTYPAWYVMEALSISEKYNLVRYVSEQPPYNLLDRRIENELLPLCLKYNLAVLPWSPLGMGILAGRYAHHGDYPEDSRAARWNNDFIKDRITRRSIVVAQALGKMAAERGLNSAQLALLWVKDQPGVTSPIVGPRTLSHLEDALAIADLALDESDRPLFDALVHPGTAVSDFHNTNSWMKAKIVEEKE